MLTTLRDDPAKYPMAVRLLVNAIIGVIICIMSGTLAVALIILGSVNNTTASILDCTQQTGTCYKDNTNRSEQLIETINSVTIYASLCIERDNITSTAELRNCVIAEYDKEHS